MKKKIAALSSVLLLVLLVASIILTSCGKGAKKKDMIPFGFTISNSNISDSFTITDTDFQALKENKIQGKFMLNGKEITLDLLAVSLKDILNYKVAGMPENEKLKKEMLKPEKIAALNGYSEYIELDKEIDKYYIAYAYKYNKNKYQSLTYNMDIRKAVCIVKNSKIVSEGLKGLYFNSEKYDVMCRVSYNDEVLNDKLKNRKIDGKDAYKPEVKLNNGVEFTFESFTNRVEQDNKFQLQKYQSLNQVTKGKEPSGLAALKGEIRAISLHDFIVYVVGDPEYKVPENVKITFEGYNKELKERIDTSDKPKTVKAKEVIIVYTYQAYEPSRKMNMVIIQKNDADDNYNTILAENCSYINIEK